MAVLNFEPQKEKRNLRGNILRVAAYIRLSSESEEQENSYDTQYEYFTRLLQSNPQWSNACDKSRWQSKLMEKNASLFIIGHEHFNKSLTLDIENRLMHYMMSAERENMYIICGTIHRLVIIPWKRFSMK